ncbi:MAG: hypothetical protein ACFCU3_00675 [Verrucomicrobiales bacterium]
MNSRLTLCVVVFALVSSHAFAGEEYKNRFSSSAYVTEAALAKAPVAYSGEHSAYPLPPVLWQRAGLASDEELDLIAANLIVPLLKESTRPIASFMVEFDEDPSTVVFTVLYTEGFFQSQLLKRTPELGVSAEDYLSILAMEYGEGCSQ